MSSVNHEAKLVTNISKLLNDEAFNDITINLNEGHGHVKANKVILCANSTYFANIFNNNVSDKDNTVINIPTTKESMELVLKYLYSGKVEFEELSLKDILDLLHLFEFTKMMDLFSTLETYLINQIGEDGFCPENILLYANVSESSKYYEVTKAMLRFLYKHIKDIVQFSEVEYLSKTLLKTFLKYATDVVCVLDNNDVFDDEAIYDDEDDYPLDADENDTKAKENVEKIKRHQIEMFKILVNWLKGNSDCDKEFVDKILEQFSLEGFTNEELVNFVRKSSLYTEKEILDTLSKNVKTLEDEIDICKKRQNDAENEMDKVEKETKKIKLENEDLNDKFNKKTIENNKLNGEIKQLKQDYKKLKDKVNIGKGVAIDFINYTMDKTTLSLSFRNSVRNEFMHYPQKYIT